ncbi:MAG TPA: M23 family metallopeptidase [Saprospiraceae bacterium]|nr:M23 family metallopeptidase [Saprospiraceae bacterium]
MSDLCPQAAETPPAQMPMKKYLGFFKKLGSLSRRNSDDDRSLMEKLRDKYRLVIMNADTFEEVMSFRLSPLSVYIGISSLVVGTAILVTMAIVWTPLKRYIPGYGDFQRDEEIAQLTNKVGDLENEIEAHRRYNENFRKLLVGDLADMSKEAAEKQGQPADQSDTLPKDIDRIPEDEQLRAQVASGSITLGPATSAAASAGSSGMMKETPLEQLTFMPPVSGELTATFDLKKEHYGVDVGAPKNTPVKAAAAGMVISSGYTVETGYSIAIQHPNNVVTMYKHNSVLLKKEGSPVKAGEAIAFIGNTGEQSTGPHLHFELWHKGRAVNPAHYINFR